MVQIAMKHFQKPQKQDIESGVSEVLYFSGGGGVLRGFSIT